MKVYWTKTALEHLVKIYEHIVHDSAAQRKKRVVDRFYDRTTQLIEGLKNADGDFCSVVWAGQETQPTTSRGGWRPTSETTPVTSIFIG